MKFVGEPCVGTSSYDLTFKRDHHLNPDEKMMAIPTLSEIEAL